MFAVHLLNPPYLRKDDTMSKLTKKQQWFKQIILTKRDKAHMGLDVCKRSILVVVWIKDL